MATTSVSTVLDKTSDSAAEVVSHFMSGEGVRFYTLLKTITQRWPTGIRQHPGGAMHTVGIERHQDRECDWS